jgi:hypothetical protein
MRKTKPHAIYGMINFGSLGVAVILFRKPLDMVGAQEDPPYIRAFTSESRQFLENQNFNPKEKR